MKNLKQIILLILVLSLVITTNAQNRKSNGDNILLPSNLIVQYFVPHSYSIFETDSIYGFNKKTYFTDEKFENVFNIIINSVLSQEVNVYQASLHQNVYSLFDDRKIISDTNIIKQNLGYFNDKIFISTWDTLTKSFVHVKEVNSYNNFLYGFNFFEEWNIGDNPLSIEKKVIGYSPVVIKNNHYSKAFLILDTLNNKREIKKSEKRMIRINSVKYEYFFYANSNNLFLVSGNNYNILNFGKEYSQDNTFTCENSPFLNSTNIEWFLNLIIEKLLNKEIEAFNFYTNEKLNYIEITNIINQIKKNIHNNSDNFIFQDKYNIESIVFNEEWYIDPVTLRMLKKIIAISPILFTSDYNENSFIFNRKPLFTIYLN